MTYLVHKNQVEFKSTVLQRFNSKFSEAIHIRIERQVATNKNMEVAIPPEIPVVDVGKLWFAEPETYPNGFSTVRVALQEPKTVTQLRFFKLR